MVTSSHSRVVLLVGATGHLGGKVARRASERGERLRALVRRGSDTRSLRALGIELVEGDLLDRASLDRALAGCSAVIATAIGYSNRQRGDRLSATDTRGNQNLIDAAAAAAVERFVFCSILTCDRAPSVPHFWNKKLSEDYLEQSGLRFVALRSGAFLDQGAKDFWAAGLRRGVLRGLIAAETPITFLHSAELADDLVQALDLEFVGKGIRIEIGSDRSVSAAELAALMSRHLGREIRVQTPPWGLVAALLRVAGPIDPVQRDLLAMMRYLRRGGYVADTAQQLRYFGKVPSIDEGVRRYLEEAGLLR